MMTNLLDSYARKAWLYPALLVSFPVVAGTVGWWPSLLSHRAVIGVSALAVTLGIAYAASAIVRELGRTTERRLLQVWGGWPTTIWLRHKDSPLDLHTAARYRAFLAKRLPELDFPTARREANNPAAADAIYHSAIAWLRSRAHANAYRMVALENASYGFRRNARGLRGVGVAAALGSLVVQIVALRGELSRKGRTLILDLDSAGGTVADLGLPVLAGTGCAIVALLFWAVVVSDKWVRQAADRYAKELLATCDYPDRPAVA